MSHTVEITTEVRDALAHNVVPALVCLDAHDVAGSLLAARTQRGVSWLRHIELLILVGADRRPCGVDHGLGEGGSF